MVYLICLFEFGFVIGLLDLVVWLRGFAWLVLVDLLWVTLG